MSKQDFKLSDSKNTFQSNMFGNMHESKKNMLECTHLCHTHGKTLLQEWSVLQWERKCIKWYETVFKFWSFETKYSFLI